MSERSEGRILSFANALIRWRYLLLWGAVALTAIAWPVAHRIAFDQTFESLYAPDDPHLIAYQHSKRLFGADEFVIVAYREPNLFQPGSRDFDFDPRGQRRIAELAKRLSEIPGVNADSTQSLVTAMRFPFGRRRARELVEGILIGEDNHTTAVVMRLLPEAESPATRAKTIAEIRAVADEFGRRHDLPEVKHGESVFIVGEPVQLHDMFRYVEEDGRTLFWWSLLLLGGVILLLFRSVRWVLLPLAVVVATIVWTEALLVASSMRLSMVSSIVNSLVTIIGIATAMHVTIRFRELRADYEPVEALRRTIVELAPPIFWNVVTTAGGFAAVLTSEITPVSSFGTIMTIAAMMVLVALITILPGGILAGRRGIDPRHTPAEGSLISMLGGTTGWVERHPVLLMAGTASLVVAALVGFSRVSVETDFTKNFRASSPIARSLDFVESRLGGAGTWEVNFPAPKKLTPEYLDRVRELTNRLRELGAEHPGLTKVTSLSDGLDVVPELPFVLNTFGKRMAVMRAVQPEFQRSLHDATEGRMRIVLRSVERQPSDAKLRLIAAAERVTREEFPPEEYPDQPPATATGLFVLLTFLVESLLGDQWASLFWGTAGLFTMMAIAFRSLPIAMISLVPNLFPIVLVIGTMGWIGLPINIATAMIASVSLGLTVDSSIHYLYDYRVARARGLTVAAALRDTHQGVGQAVVLSNLALIIGFSVLTLSHFIPLIHFGILVSAAMLGGLIGNLLLLPLLVRWIDREPAATLPEADVSEIEEREPVSGGSTS